MIARSRSHAVKHININTNAAFILQHEQNLHTQIDTCSSIIGTISGEPRVLERCRKPRHHGVVCVHALDHRVIWTGHLKNAAAIAATSVQAGTLPRIPRHGVPVGHKAAGLG